MVERPPFPFLGGKFSILSVREEISVTFDSDSYEKWDVPIVFLLIRFNKSLCMIIGLTFLIGVGRVRFELSGHGMS